MRVLRILLVAVMIGGFTIRVGGCSSAPKPPLYADPQLATMSFETITVLPIVDARIDKSEDFDLEQELGERLEGLLADKGYDVERPGDFSDRDRFSHAQVAAMNDVQLASLGPAAAEPLLVLYLNDASGEVGLGASYNLEATAVLVSKRSGEVLWRNKSVQSIGMGGAAGCMVASQMDGKASELALKEMFGSFPERI